MLLQMMMTTRPWPPLHQQSPFSPPLKCSDAAKFGGADQDYSKASFHQNTQHLLSRYGMAPLRRDCKQANNYFSATPLYHRPPFAAVPIPYVPSMKMLARHMLLVEVPPPRERPHCRQQHPQHQQRHPPMMNKCSCFKVRSRSLENLYPSDVTTTSTITEDREVFLRRRRKLGKENFKRRSMDNLLEGGKVSRKKVSEKSLYQNCKHYGLR